MCPHPLVGSFLNPWLSKYVNCSEYDELVIGRLEPIERAENVVPDALARQRLRERLNAMRQRIPPQPRLHPQRGRRFLTLDHRPHLLPPSISFSMNYRCARKPRNAAEVHETSAGHRSQARHPAWVAGRVVPAAPSNADHEPNGAPKAELAELPRDHLYYEVAMLRTATSTTSTVRLPIRCQQATSR